MSRAGTEVLVRRKKGLLTASLLVSKRLFLLYRKFLKTSEMVYNSIKIKMSMTKERRWDFAMTLIMQFLFLVWLHYLTIEKTLL